MTPSPSLAREGRRTTALAFPLIIGQLGQMMIADTVMVGKVGVTELAAPTFATRVIKMACMKN